MTQKPSNITAESNLTLALLRDMNKTDAEIAAAVVGALPQLAKIVDAIVARIPHGGRVYYIGAGTSGRLGVLDASEWYPTFGTEHGLVNAVIAGGTEAVFRSVEGAEDNEAQGAVDLEAAGAKSGDIIIGISASGTTPYVRGALQWAQKNKIFCAGLVCHKVAKFPAEILAEIPVGPEFVEGSSRLKAGTATKMALNLISTVAMIRLGRVHAGRMIEVRKLSNKLIRRAEDIVVTQTQVSPARAKELLDDAEGDIKIAILMAKRNLSARQAAELLQVKGASLDELLGEAPSAILEKQEKKSLAAFLADYEKLETKRVIGLMSGTSADAVHAALVEISGVGDATTARLLGFSHEQYSEGLRDKILRLFSPDCPVAFLCEMNFTLGEVFAVAAKRLAEAHGGLGSVNLIASHGQTVCHLPIRKGESDSFGSTLQIGEPAVIAERTAVAVASDFRVADIAAGGQGAPLSAFADYMIFRHPARGRAIQNIGGIGNVTFIPAGAKISDIIAFDTGPGNMLIDCLVSEFSEGKVTYDSDGQTAASGQINETLLAWLMSHEFILQPPPKTAGREEFGLEFARAVISKAKASGLAKEDVIATATAFTAETIADAYRRFLFPKGTVDEVILGGGGTYNKTLRQWICERLSGIAVYTHEDFGIPGHAKEALAFAILGNETLLGRAAGLPNVTGAKHPTVLGKITPAYTH